MGRLPGPFLPPIAMIGPFLDRSPLMGSFGGKSQLPPGGLQKLLRHVLVDQVKVVQVLCAGGGAYSSWRGRKRGVAWAWPGNAWGTFYSCGWLGLRRRAQLLMASSRRLV